MKIYLASLWILFLAVSPALFAQSAQSIVTHNLSIPNNLVSPVRMAVDHDDVIYVSDFATKDIRKFDIAGNFLGTLVFAGSPLSLAINSANQVFIGDDQTGIIYKTDAGGSVSVFYTSCLFPASMAFDNDDNLYIADSKLQEVHVVSPSGELIRTIGTGLLIYPTGIVYDPENARVYVAEHGGIGNGFDLHAEIRVFDTAGNPLSTIGSYGSGDGEFYRVQGIRTNRCGNLFAVDSYQGQISIFDENGTFLSKFGQFGKNPGDLNLPMDIIFDSQDHAIVASLNNGALEVFNVAPASASSEITFGNAVICEGETVDIPVYLTGAVPWSLTYSIDGINADTITGIATSPYVIHATGAGEYIVASLSDAATTGTCLSGKAVITVNPLPASVIADTGSTICQGSTALIPVTLTGTAPWSITYTVDGIGPVQVNSITENPYILQVSAGGLYEITAVGDALCTGNTGSGSALVTIQDTPVSGFSFIADNLNVIFSNTSLYATSVLWDFGDGSFSSEANPSYSYAAPGVYVVALTVTNPCGVSVYTETLNILNVRAETMGPGNFVKVYPNPAKGLITVDPGAAANKKCAVEIITVTGQVICSRTINKEKENIDVSHFARGVYTLKIVAEGTNRNEKLILID